MSSTNSKSDGNINHIALAPSLPIVAGAWDKELRLLKKIAGKGTSVKDAAKKRHAEADLVVKDLTGFAVKACAGDHEALARLALFTHRALPQVNARVIAACTAAGFDASLVNEIRSSPDYWTLRAASVDTQIALLQAHGSAVQALLNSNEEELGRAVLQLDKLISARVLDAVEVKYNFAVSGALGSEEKRLVDGYRLAQLLMDSQSTIDVINRDFFSKIRTGDIPQILAKAQEILKKT